MASGMASGIAPAQMDLIARETLMINVMETGAGVDAEVETREVKQFMYNLPLAESATPWPCCCPRIYECPVMSVIQYIDRGRTGRTGRAGEWYQPETGSTEFAFVSRKRKERQNRDDTEDGTENKERGNREEGTGHA